MEPLVVAAAQPEVVARDVAANAAAHAAAVRAADARVVVFPELSLTGYELDAEPVQLDALGGLVEACRDCVAFVGAPVEEDGRRFIAVLRVDGAGVDVVYRKTFLGGNEPASFAAGPGPVAVEVDGWRVGLGVCKDTGVARHVDETAALDVDLYLAGLVHLPEELEEQDARGERIARACGAYVAFASFAGPTGDVFAQTAGTSTIWDPGGERIARAGTSPGGLARATLVPRRTPARLPPPPAAAR